MPDLSGLTALVTGGSGGLGRAIATELKTAGAELIISGSNAEKLGAAAQDLGAKAIVANLANPDEVSKLAQEAGAVDILVNNAGITRDGLLLRMKNDDISDVLQVNLQAAMQLSRDVLGGMLKNKFGRIINITSVVGHMGNTGQANYVAAKAGLTGFTKALATEVARKNVTANCVAPGFIDTAMTAELPEATQTEFLSKIPARRFGTPAEVAHAAAFLASREASYITGTTMHVNGGLYL